MLDKDKFHECGQCGTIVSEENYEIRCGCPVCGEIFTSARYCSRDAERQQYTDRFIKITEEITDLARGAKTSDYGETWRELGLMGIYVKLFIKEGRLHNLLWKQKSLDTEVNDESVRDTLMDMAAYAIYGIIALDEENMTGADFKEDKVRGVIHDLEEIMGGMQ